MLINRYPLVKRFLRGKPVELTEASEAVADLRRVLETDGVIEFRSVRGNSGCEIDTGGDVYWNDTRTVAVYVPR